MAAPSGLMLALQVIKGRWFMVFACLLIMEVAGASYIFGIYSEEIKKKLGYNQQTLGTISFFKDLGSNLGVVSGLIQEVSAPWLVLLMGAGMNLSGYLMIWLAVTGRTATPQVWQMCLYIFLGSNSQAFANTGALVTCVKNFPRSRGVVLGLLKGLMGLSGAILTQLYHAFYGDDAEALILLIGWLPTAISIFFVFSIREIKASRIPNEIEVFYKFLYIVLVLVAYLMTIIIIQKEIKFSMLKYQISAAIVMVLVFLPLVLVIKEELSIIRNTNQSTANADSASINVEIEKPRSLAKLSSAASASEEQQNKTAMARILDAFRPPPRGEDYTILQALVSLDMITLFITSICGIGGTLAAMDNLGQIGRSLGYPPHGVSTCISLMSIWNCLGRLTSGFVSETLLNRHKVPRPLILTIVLLIAIVGHLLIAFAPPESLYIASVIIGFSFGAQWPLLFAIISEIFGLKYYSTLYNFGGMASPVGSYILNVLVTGQLYDKVALRQRTQTGVITPELNCTGVECFKLSFLIVAGVTVFGAAVSCILVARTFSFYRRDIYAKFREPTGEEVQIKMSDPTFYAITKSQIL
ncbi:protein NUCLEAR FUSION DEFECTIVE 4-like [Aristolochia californica]|uniref:protein NUCLEAR FUSION DEFECTIVE 4-like n=1 Tax=Aristolochia californica TaxID=171875 RepID=UPI0035D9B7C4